MNIKESFSDYVDVLRTIEPGEFAPYDWLTFPNPLPKKLMVYQMMATEHVRELSNSINKFNQLISSIGAWEKVLAPLDDEEKTELVDQFIDTKATISLNFPYVIRSRFIFSIAHLCHQANRFCLTDWRDDLPMDEKIYFEAADKYGANWKKYKKTKVAIEGIGNKNYQSETKDFRNKYNHRYSPRIEVGITNLVSRNINDSGDVSYGIGGCQPLELVEIVPLLKGQQNTCIRAYEKYQLLLLEHVEKLK